MRKAIFFIISLDILHDKKYIFMNNPCLQSCNFKLLLDLKANLYAS